MVEGDRSCTRPARRWTDDITDWCGCTLPLPEAVELGLDRKKLRKITELNGPRGP